jgi:biofilm PGA synthesis protein PgaA
MRVLPCILAKVATRPPGSDRKMPTAQCATARRRPARASARCRALAVLVLLGLPPSAAIAQDAARLQREGVSLAREGRHAEGLRLLEAALAAAPGDPGVIADIVTVLTWDGADAEALRRFAALGEARAPAWGLGAAATAARRSGDPARAAHLYRLALARGGEQADWRLGLALAEAARDRPDPARAEAAAALRLDPGLAEARELLRRLDRARALAVLRARLDAGDAGAAAEGAIAAVRRDPDAAPDLAEMLLGARLPFDALRVLDAGAPSPAARRLRLLAEARMGAPGLAEAGAARDPATLSPAERRDLVAGETAYLIRWGAGVAPDPRDPAGRFAMTDRALARLDAAIAGWGADPAAIRDVRLARMDRVIALRDRRRYAEALAEGRALAAEGPLPPHVRVALGDSHLALQAPEDAEAEYRAALAEDPGTANAGMSLFFALSDQQRWAEARALAATLDEAAPAFRPLAGGEGAVVANWDKLDPATAHILWHLWSGDAATAGALADGLLRVGGANAGLRALRADILRSRGWPAASLAEAEAALTDAPDSMALGIGRFHALMDLRDWRAAAAQIEALQAALPEELAVQRAARRWTVHNLWELESEATTGLTRQASTPEVVATGRIFSPPIGWDWRLFAGVGLRQSDTPEGPFAWGRAEAGAEYRAGPWQIRAAGTHDEARLGRLGGWVQGSVRLSDAWRLDADAESFARDTPLRALKGGVTAWAAGLGGAWRESERREIGASARVMPFSDGNQRLVGFVRWQERAWQGAGWSLDVQPYAYATSNSQPGGPYYAPRRDLETGASLILNWLVWARHDRDFRIRASATAAGYWQEDHGWTPAVSLAWEHRHGLSDTLALDYGIGWSRRAYDGVQEQAVSGRVALRWRF